MEDLHRCQLPVCPRRAAFVGSCRRMVVVGGSAVLVLHADSESTSASSGSPFQSSMLSSLSLPDNASVTNFEVISAQGKCFLACASLTPKGSNIRLVEMQAQSIDQATLVDYGDLHLDVCTEGACTSLTFDVFSKRLALSYESGVIVNYDAQAGREVSRFAADPCGVTQVKFKLSDTLVSTSAGCKNQLRMWDVRSADCVGRYHHVGKGGGAYTCVGVHGAQDRLVCGTSQGWLAVWDLRTGSMDAHQTHSGRVTAAAFDPVRGDVCLSASADGTLVESSLLVPAYRRLVDEPSASIASLDLDPDSNCLLACSSLGALWRMPSSHWLHSPTPHD